MKKTTKGAVAVAGAAVLLAGGAGTLAYWNDTATINGGTITAGDLRLTALDAGTWKLNGTTVPSISAVRVVPGDQLTFTGSYDITAVGDNLQADVSVDGATVSGGLAPKLTTSVTKTVGGAAVGPITEDDDGDDVVVTATFDFPFGATVDNTSKTLTADLSNVTVTLTQTDATP